MPGALDEILEYAEARVTPCQVFPERCKPRKVDMVLFDADDTMWDIKPYGIASNITGELRRIDEDTVEAVKRSWFGTWGEEREKPKKKKYRKPWGWGWKPILWEEEEFIPELPPPKETKVTIKLKPGLRKVLDELQDRGIKAAVISLNSPGSVKRILEAFGLADKFVEIADTWRQKDQVFDEIVEKHHVPPCNTIFVDDNLGHVRRVSDRCALALQFEKDIKTLEEILNYIE